MVGKNHPLPNTPQGQELAELGYNLHMNVRDTLGKPHKFSVSGVNGGHIAYLDSLDELRLHTLRIRLNRLMESDIEGEAYDLSAGILTDLIRTQERRVAGI